MNSEEIEKQVREISGYLRCPVCQNIPVADSPAPLAREMRELIREKVSEGWSKNQILEFFVKRYGDWVLLEPPKKGAPLLVWFSPVLAFMLGTFFVLRLIKRKEKVKTEEYLQKMENTPQPQPQPKNLPKYVSYFVIFILLVSMTATSIIAVKPKTNRVNKLLSQAEVYLSEKKIFEALDLYRKVLEIDPNNETAFLKYFFILIHSGHSDIALDTVENILKDNPQNLNAMYIKGIALYFSKKYKEASEAWKNMLPLLSGDDRKRIQNLIEETEKNKEE